MYICMPDWYRHIFSKFCVFVCECQSTHFSARFSITSSSISGDKLLSRAWHSTDNRNKVKASEKNDFPSEKNNFSGGENSLSLFSSIYPRASGKLTICGRLLILPGTLEDVKPNLERGFIFGIISYALRRVIADYSSSESNILSCVI